MFMFVTKFQKIKWIIDVVFHDSPRETALRLQEEPL